MVFEAQVVEYEDDKNEKIFSKFFFVCLTISKRKTKQIILRFLNAINGDHKSGRKEESI